MPWTYEYDPATGAISGAVNNIIPLAQPDPPGRALFRDNDDAYKPNMMVDVTQVPPVLVAAPPPPPPAADMLTHVFNAMVQQGYIDPAHVDPSILTKANISLSMTGAKTITVMAAPSS